MCINLLALGKKDFGGFFLECLCSFHAGRFVIILDGMG
jgi:hypothetical protein